MANSEINFKREVAGQPEEIVARLTEQLKTEGFGILTRIDMHEKFKEKLGKEIQPAIILGSCNPALAYEAYQANPDVTSLLPCNAVVRQLAPGKCSVELARPSAMMEMLGEKRLADLARDADARLERVLSRL